MGEKNFYREEGENGRWMCSTCNSEVFGGICDCMTSEKADKPCDRVYNLGSHTVKMIDGKACCPSCSKPILDHELNATGKVASHTQSDKTLKPIEMWEAMFGNSVSAKAGIYVADYKKFIRLITARENRLIQEAVDKAKLKLLREAYGKSGVLVEGISEVERFIIHEMVELEGRLTNNTKEGE